MSSLRTIRNRIKGTRNIKQITRAMEAVSAVKMRKSQSVALAARPYATAALNILKNVTDGSTKVDMHHRFLNMPKNGEILLAVVTSDKGLAGPFNTNVLKRAMEFVRENERQNRRTRLVTVGRKATEFFQRRHHPPRKNLRGLSDSVNLEDVTELYKEFSMWSSNYEEMYICYTNFLSAMKQEVVVRKLLPFSEEGLEEMVKGIVPERGRFSMKDTNIPMGTNETNSTNKNREYLFEPSPREIFDSILPALLRIQIYHAILEANASEHSSRMVAMRNATDNASELIKTYTVSMNKARQSAINKELAEITGGSEALAA